MTYTPCHKRTFPLKMVPQFTECYLKYIHLLKHLLERLGHECTLKIWDYAFKDYSDELLSELLAGGWKAVEGEGVEIPITEALSEHFASPVENVSAEQARQIIEESPPFYQIRQHLPNLNVIKEMSAYSAMHLFFHGYALLTEALIELHGKQGEFIAYDVKLQRVQANAVSGVSAEEFLASFTTPLDKSTRLGAAVEYDLVRASENEVVLHIKECELARYYLEHHPRVGYLMGCSMDEAEYRAANPRIRTQRTTTLMEGGELCDFRIYAVEEPNSLK